MSTPKEYLEELEAKTLSPVWNTIGVKRDASGNFKVLVVGYGTNAEKYKLKTFTSEGLLLSDTDFKSLSDLNSTDVSLFQSIFGRQLPDIKKTRVRIGAFAPPPVTVIDPEPPAPIDFGDIVGDYNANTGYGEIDLREALELITGEELDEVSDTQGKVSVTDTFKVTDPTLTRSGALEAHAAGYKGQEIIVAVIDTGVNINHNDIDDNIWRNTDEIAGNGIDDDGNGYIDDIHGWNTADNNNDISDIQGHGTHVAGIIAAEDNGIGRCGVAPEVKIMVLNSFKEDADGNVSAAQADTNEAIYYAVDNGAHVINMSLGSEFPFILDERKEALKYASDNGVICVYAAGNAGASRPGTPGIAAHDIGVVVGAVDSSGRQANFSNKAGGPGDFLDDGVANQLYVTAAGVSIWSHDRASNDGLVNKQGTSMACPVVAGAIAVMLSAEPDLDENDIRVILANTSYDSAGAIRGF